MRGSEPATPPPRRHAATPPRRAQIVPSLISGSAVWFDQSHQSWQAPAHSPPPLWPLWSSSVFSDYTNRFSACLVPSKGRGLHRAHLRGWISRRTFWRLARWWARCTDWFCGLPSDFQSSVGARNRRCTLRSRGWSIWHARYEQQSRPRVLSRAPQRLVGGGEAAQPIFFRGKEIFVRDFLEDIATGKGK